MQRSSIIAGALFLLGAALSFPAAAAQDTPHAAPPAAAADSGDDAGKRLQRIEEQIVDLSAQLGTVETMARAGSAAPAAQSAGDTPAGGADAARVAQLEVEVRALSAQMNEILQRLQQLDGRAGAPAPGPAAAQPAASPPASAGGGFGATNMEPAQEAAPKPAPKKKSSGSGGFFGLFNGSSDEPAQEPENLTPSAPVQPKAQPMNNSGASSGGGSVAPAIGGGSAPQTRPQVQAALSPAQGKALYDQAFMALQEGNPRAAAEGFEEFVQRYPSDAMTGSAHFWLGEAAFTNGEYRKAADNYLKTATDFPKSEKAPESLFKLGVALKRLNETDAACSTFSELARRYPDAASLLQRADAEKRRAKCS